MPTVSDRHSLPVGCVVGTHPGTLDIRDVICIRRCRLQIANSIRPALAGGVCCGSAPRHS
ncbi:MAG: hypothetical protein MUC60_12320 [Oscillatoria sp. Prado101]|nr:hypothetical protein [Oscillatoria sp. Prado101]